MTKDEGGHGTRCTGTIGSRTYGVAKKVDLFAIGALNGEGNGEMSKIVKGIEFAVKHHKNATKNKKPGFKGLVVNLSLSSGISIAADKAVNKATEAELHVVIAAGNENIDACEKSPGRAAGPITVGATNSSDSSSNFSNFGQCVDIFAPGEDIESTYIGPDVKISSGTSMAVPHVAGIVSYFLSLQPELWSEFATGLIEPADLKKIIIGYGIRGKITGLDDTSPNILAFNGGGGDLTDLWMMWWYER